MDDKFADIAHRGRNVEEDSMQRVPPRDITPDPLPAYDGSVPSAAPAEYEERLESFDDELAALREQHEPFLRELQPPTGHERPRTALTAFDFRYKNEADTGAFQRILDGKGEWESVTIPEYRGPEGRWTGYYRTTFEYAAPDGDRVYLRFEGVDYEARVYLNGECVGEHEGVFAPFEFDVTDALRNGSNTLVVEVRNDVPMIGVQNADIEGKGDKIHAVNSPGWDDPYGGWQTCPSGAGIYSDVILEERSPVHVEDTFVRARPDSDIAEAWIEIENTDMEETEVDLDLTVYPQNFQGEAIDGGEHTLTAERGRNDHKISIPLEEWRPWSPEEPWLYALQVHVSVDGECVDAAETQFGMRSYEIDETTDPKGELRFNGEAIRLRGANTMGHLQRCVMADDREQLIEDVLIGKLANQNYFRLTQRPVQAEVYEICDKLGMCLQTDLPLFGHLRRNKVTEAIRQAEEMERHIRGHPSTIHSSLMNEAFDVISRGDGHRFCSRPELEDFFDSATDAIRLNNPDRDVKRVEGDYHPPTRTGLSDAHCYTMWYTNHSQPIGEMHAGWLPTFNTEWRTACGEYGTEGLDNLDVMLEHYPEEWLPDDIEDPWLPNKIYSSQTYGMHGDWFDEQETIQEWIDASQAHQARATTLMTDAFRRRADWVTMSAIHLLIDAWPDGWMKSIVDTHRTPKPAYFAYQDAIEPVRAHLRTDRHTYEAGEAIDVELWTLNDTGKTLEAHRVEVAVRIDDTQIDARALEDVTIAKASSAYEGHVDTELPAVEKRTSVAVDAVLTAPDGETVNEERLELEVFPQFDGGQQRVVTVGESATTVADTLGIDQIDPDAGLQPDVAILVGGEASLTDPLLEAIENGATAVLLRRGEGRWNLGGTDVQVVDHHGLTFVARDEEAPETTRFEEMDFAFHYDNEAEHIGFLADTYLEAADLESLLYTYPDQPDVGGELDWDSGSKEAVPIVGKLDHGAGTVYVSELRVAELVGSNPVIDRFILSLLAE